MLSKTFTCNLLELTRNDRCESDCRSRGREFDPGPVPYFREDYEIISTVYSLPLNHSRRIAVSYKRNYVHEVLVNCLFKLAPEKKCGKVN